MIIPSTELHFDYLSWHDHVTFTSPLFGADISAGIAVIEWCAEQFGADCALDYDWKTHQIRMPIDTSQAPLRWSFQLHLSPRQRPGPLAARRRGMMYPADYDHGWLGVLFWQRGDAAAFRLAFITAFADDRR